MTTTNQNSIGNEVGRRLVKTAIAVVGLLLIRLLLDNLPMLKEAKPILVGDNPMTPSADLARIAQEYFRTGQLPQELQGIAKQYAMPYIFPISIANAIVDTLIFIVLLWSAEGFNGLIQARSKRLPEGGRILQFLIFTIVVALAYHSYRSVVPPLLGSHADLYGWLFLVLGLMPLIGLIVVASRNLDAITEVVFSSASRTVTQAPAPQVKESSAVCAKCGGAVAAGVKFCSACGAPVPAASAPAQKFCPECGLQNEGGAKFCKSCGKPLAATS